jgi:hypothetical protein
MVALLFDLIMIVGSENPIGRYTMVFAIWRPGIIQLIELEIRIFCPADNCEIVKASLGEPRNNDRGLSSADGENFETLSGYLRALKKSYSARLKRPSPLADLLAFMLLSQAQCGPNLSGLIPEDYLQMRMILMRQ